MPKITSERSLRDALNSMIAEEAKGAKEYLALRKAIKRTFPSSRARDKIMQQIGHIYGDELNHKITLQDIKRSIARKRLV